MKILIEDGRVIDPANNIDSIHPVAIDNGKIVAVGEIPAGFKADTTINAQNQWVLPGLVDVHFSPSYNKPGFSLQQEAKAAIARGITSICIAVESEPFLDSNAHVMRLLDYQNAGLPHFYPIGALTKGCEAKIISDLTSLAQIGCVAFSNGPFPITDLRMLKHCYDYASNFNLITLIQPQDYWLAKGGVAHEGIVGTRLGLAGIPETAETISIAQHLLMIENSDARAHFTRVSCANSLNLLLEAKAKGLKITADCTMQALHLTEMDINGFDSNCHLYPPLRSFEDRSGLIQGISNGTLNAICSDHRPLNRMDKLKPFGDTIPGLSAVDTFLSLGLHLVKEERLTANEWVRSVTCGPAAVFNLPVGTLTPGANADICIIDPNIYWQVTEEALLSEGKNTPFLNWEIPGKVITTILKGEIVHAA